MSKLEPWQQQTLDTITNHKYQGRGVMQITGRQTGKSILNNMFSGQALQRIMDDIMERPIEDLVLSEGTVFGARYYCVEPVGGFRPDMESWCLDTYGDPGDHMWGGNQATKPGHRWYRNNRKFWFRDIKDRDWFVLRWRS